LQVNEENNSYIALYGPDEIQLFKDQGDTSIRGHGGIEKANQQVRKTKRNAMLTD